MLILVFCLLDFLRHLLACYVFDVLLDSVGFLVFHLIVYTLFSFSLFLLFLLLLACSLLVYPTFDVFLQVHPRLLLLSLVQVFRVVLPPSLSVLAVYTLS